MTNLISIASTHDRPVVVATPPRGDRADTDVWALLADQRWQLQDPEDTNDGEDTYPTWALADMLAGSGRRGYPGQTLVLVTGVDQLHQLEPGSIVRPEGERWLFRFDGRRYFSLDPADTNDGRFPADLDCDLIWEVIWRPSLAD